MNCWLQADIIAGISVGAMVVPQGMSYAKLAGLPNVYGLYGAFVPVMIYAILGSSPQLVSFCSSASEFNVSWPVQQIWFLTVVTPAQSALVMWFVQCTA